MVSIKEPLHDNRAPLCLTSVRLCGKIWFCTSGVKGATVFFTTESHRGKAQRRTDLRV